MKKLLSLILCVALVGCMCNSFVFAADKDEVVGVRVTVYCEKDGMVERNSDYSVGVSDRDNDGVITVSDALNATHFEYCAYDDGYATRDAEEGLEIAKLWGFEDGVCGVYVNHKPVANLLTEVKDGDMVYAYRLDPDAEPKKYCYFDKTKAKFSENELSLTLTAVEFDENGNPVEKPLQGAAITIDQKPSNYVTDKEGKVTIQRGYFELYVWIAHENYIVIGAKTDSDNLFPPICKVKYPEFELPSANVTLADSKGNLVLADQYLPVPDWDGDGKRTVNDALISAHEFSFQDGGAEGYVTKKEKGKLSIQKLWGDKINGKYGCYVNQEPASGLLQKLERGDDIYLFCYQDTKNLSDKYCYFNEASATLEKGEEQTLYLEMYYEVDGEAITAPVQNATILIDGKETEYKTDEEGAVTLSFDSDNHDGYLISARSDTLTITPPVCKVYVYGDVDLAGTLDEDMDVGKDLAASPQIVPSVSEKNESEPYSSEKAESKPATTEKIESKVEYVENKSDTEIEEKDPMISPQTGISFPIYPLLLSLVFAIISLFALKKFGKE